MSLAVVNLAHKNRSRTVLSGVASWLLTLGADARSVVGTSSPVSSLETEIVISMLGKLADRAFKAI